MEDTIQGSRYKWEQINFHYKIIMSDLGTPRQHANSRMLARSFIEAVDVIESGQNPNLRQTIAIKYMVATYHSSVTDNTRLELQGLGNHLPVASTHGQHQSVLFKNLQYNSVKASLGRLKDQARQMYPDL